MYIIVYFVKMVIVSGEMGNRKALCEICRFIHVLEYI